MAIIQTDILIRTMLEGAIYDMRKNPWLLDDVFGGLASDPLSRIEYGYKEVKAAKDWFLNNDIKVYLPFRIDNPTLPCLSIMQESCSEMKERASLADSGGFALEESVNPNGATTQPQYVIPPFSPAGYNINEGIITLPDTASTENFSNSYFLVSVKSGKAYQILKILGDKDFQITPKTIDNFEGAYIVPPTNLWNLNREIAFLFEQYDIGCHASSDPVITLWLRSLVMYILFRYRETYLESRGFEISTIAAGAININPNFGSEKVYSCSIKLEGQTEASWIKYIAPKLNFVKGGIVIADGPKTPPSYKQQVDKQGWKMEGDVEPQLPIKSIDTFIPTEDVTPELYDEHPTEDDTEIDVLGDSE